jgi:Leucine Rich repeat
MDAGERASENATSRIAGNLQSMPMTAPKRSRLLRFSLASLLVVVTAVGIYLGPIVNRVHHQSRTIEAIEKIGGKVDFEGEPDGARQRFGWLRQWLDDDFFRTPSLIHLRGCPATDDLVKDISRLDGVVQLDVCDSEVTDESLRQVGRMRQLKALDVGFNKISNDGLAHLAPLDELLYLGLDVTEVTDDGLVHLRELPKLYRLQLYGARVTDQGAATLATMPWICEFDLANTLITNDGLAHLAKMPNLTAIRLDQMSLGSGEELRINDEGLQHLLAMPKLRDVSLANLAVTDAGLTRLKTERPALKIGR